MSEITRPVIVVPVHNALEHTQRLFTDLYATAWSLPWVVVDDASAVETSRWLNDEALRICCHPNRSAEFRLTKHARQQLYTRSANHGARIAQEEHSPDAILFLNTDCRLQPGWWQALVAGMNRDPHIGVVGYAEGPDGKRPLYREQFCPEYVTGHCWLARVAMLDQIGLLCETDTDGRDSPELAAFHGQAHLGSERVLCTRAQSAGWRTLYCHAPLVEHGGGPSWHGRDLGWLNRFQPNWLWEPCDHWGPVVELP